MGVNPELVELENNFPRFNLLIGEDEPDTSILKRVIKKGNELRNATEEQYDKLNVAKETEGFVKPVFSHTNVWSKQEEKPETTIANKIDDIVKTCFLPYQCMVKTRRRICKKC